MSLHLITLYSALAAIPLSMHATATTTAHAGDTIRPKIIAVAPPTPPATPQDTADCDAEFPGGTQALWQFIYRNLEYPEEAVRDSIEGAVRVRFMVKEDGAVGAISITQPLHTACDAAVVAVIKKLPRFAPAKKKGKPIAMAFVVPIRFRLE